MKLWDVRLAPMTQANIDSCTQLLTDPFSFRVQFGTFQNMYYFRADFSDSARLIPFVADFASNRPASLFWHRDNPAPQPIGLRGLVHDGAGLASPSFFGWDSPISKFFLPDPLHQVREVMLAACSPQLRSIVASLEDLHLRDSSCANERHRSSVFAALQSALEEAEVVVLSEFKKQAEFLTIPDIFDDGDSSAQRPKAIKYFGGIPCVEAVVKGAVQK